MGISTRKHQNWWALCIHTLLWWPPRWKISSASKASGHKRRCPKTPTATVQRPQVISTYFNKAWGPGYWWHGTKTQEIYMCSPRKSSNPTIFTMSFCDFTTAVHLPEYTRCWIAIATANKFSRQATLLIFWHALAAIGFISLRCVWVANW